MENNDVDNVRKALETWGNEANHVPMNIREGAVKHFENGFKIHFSDRYNLFLMAEKIDNGSIYGVTAAYTDDSKRAQSGYIVNFGTTAVGSVLMSEKLKAALSNPDIWEIEALLESEKGKELLEKFYFRVFEHEPKERAILTKPVFKKLMKDHPEYFI